MPSSYVEPPVAPPPAEQLSFLSVLNFVLRNVVLLIVPGVLLAILLVARARMAPPSYTSTTIFSTGEASSPGAYFGIPLPGFIAGKGPSFYVDLMTSPAVLDSLVEQKVQVGPGKPPETLVEHYGGTTQPRAIAKDAAMGAVASKIHTKISATSGWVTLDVTAETPTLAVTLAQAILAQIDAFNTNTKRAQSIADQKFAQERLVDEGAQLRAAEDEYQRFRETNKDISSPALTLQNDRLLNIVSMRRGIYQTILSNYERQKADQEREARVLTIIGPPKTPTGPDRIAWKRISVLGLFAGALLGAIIAVVKEYFRWIREHPSPEYAEFSALRSRLFGWLPRRSTAGGKR